MERAISDREEILAVHKRWMNASVGLNIEEMRQCFVQGKHLDMWNRNGHAYHGVDELAQLWRYLRETVDLTVCHAVTPPSITVVGDVGWVAWEKMVMDIEPRNGDPVRHYVMRGTEVYRRDDGRGNSRWTIWHCHYSETAPEGSRRPGF